MIDRGIKYNASGYFDPTAFEAIKNLDKERGGSTVTPTANKGEIWEVETADGSKTYEMVVIQNFGKYNAGLMLRDTAPFENGVQIKSRGLMYADTGRLTYAYHDKFVSFIRELSGPEFDELRDKICSTLDLSWNSGWSSRADAPGEPVDTTPDLRQLEDENRALKDALVAAQRDRADLEARLHSAENSSPELAAIMKERDIYHDLYRELLDKLTTK